VVPEVAPAPPPPEEFASLRLPISFAIPLPEPLSNAEECGGAEKPPCHVHYINPAGEEVRIFGFVTEPATAACSGSAEEPTAAPGNLCVYAAAVESAKGSFNENIKAAGEPAESTWGGSSTAGAFLRISGLQNGANGHGTWAVTAGEE
jgi:hypothetical protein